MKTPRLNFNAGELMPELHYRSDLNKYSAGLKRCENFVPLPQGGLKRRNGTSTIARVGDLTSHDGARVIKWEVDRENYFQFIFAGTEIKIYSNHGALVDTITGFPWQPEDFAELYAKQIYDVMYIAHSNHPLQRIERTDQFSWGIVEHLFDGAPMEDFNTDEAKVFTLTATEINSNFDAFTVEDVGREIKVKNGADTSLYGTFTTTQGGEFSEVLPCSGAVSMRTEGGVWGGRLELQESFDDGVSWETIGSVQSQKGKHNGEITREISGINGLVRVSMALRESVSQDTGCQWYLEVDSSQYTYYKITGYTSASQVTIEKTAGQEVLGDVSRWALGAFGGKNGYPSCLEIFEERLMLGGVPAKPATIYGSAINNWAEFITGTLATSSIAFSLASDTRNRIRWFAAEKVLLIGTDGGEWSIGSREKDKALSGENVSAQRHTQYGCDPVQPINSSDMTMFVEAGGRRLRGIKYTYETDGYSAADMSILVMHLTRNNKIVKLSYSRSPDQIVWALLDNGELLSFVYNPSHEVSAWARQVIDGKVLDINSTLTREGDVVTLLIERSDGVYLEEMKESELLLDWQKSYFQVADNSLVALEGAENFKVFGSNGAPLAHTSGAGRFIRLRDDYADDGLIFEIDNERVDPVRFAPKLYWLPNSEGALVVMDIYNVILLDQVEIFITNTSSSQVLTVRDPSAWLDWASFPGLTEGEDFYINYASRQAFVFSSDPIVTNIDASDYTTFVPGTIIHCDASEWSVGIPFASIVETTDIYNVFQHGGPGMRSRIHEVELFLVNSMGGEVSGNAGEEGSFEPLPYMNKTVTAGEKQPDFSGKMEVRLAPGYSDEQTVTIKNDSNRQQTLVGLGIKGKRISE